MFRTIELSVMFTTTPEVARRRVLQALRRARGRIKDAADLLGISQRSLYRILDEHELREAQQALAARAPSRMGRPLGAKDRAPRKPRRPPARKRRRKP